MDYKKGEKVVLVWCLTVNVFYTIEKVHFAYKSGMISIRYNNKKIYFKNNVLVDKEEREENKITGHLDIKCYKYSKALIQKVQKEHDVISRLNKVNDCDIDIEMLINSKIKMISNLKYSRLVNRKGMGIKL